MTHPPTPPEPGEPTGPPDGSGIGTPPPGGFDILPPGATPPDGPGAPPPAGFPQPTSAPPLRPAAPSPHYAYDPGQSYTVYQQAPAADPYALPADPYALPAGAAGAPSGGYGVPVMVQQAGFDPLISPDYAGWWQRSLAVVRAAWKQLLLLQALAFLLGLAVAVPEGLYALRVLNDFSVQAQHADATSTQPDFTPLLATFGLILATLIVSSLIACVFTVAGNHVAVSVAAGLPPRLGAAFGLAARRFLPLWGWQLLASLITVVGLCLCVLPGIYLYAVFLILPVVVTFERGFAIERCFRLFHRDFGSAIARIATIVGISVLVGVVTYVITQIVDAATGATASMVNSASSGSGVVYTGAVLTSAIISNVIAGVIKAGAKLLTDVLTITAYADMRARLEPLSTAALAAELGLSPATGSEWLAQGPPPAY